MDKELDALFKKSQPSTLPTIKVTNFHLNASKKAVVVKEEEPDTDSEAEKEKRRSTDFSSDEEEQPVRKRRVKAGDISSDQEEQPVRKRKVKVADSEEKLARTIFIGNVPVACVEKENEKNLKAKFSVYGPIESMRFRSVAFSKPMEKKAAFLAGKLHQERDSLNAYIVFKDKEVAVKALAENGKVFLDKHLRVDMADSKSKCDNRRSVFLGNLPLSINEEKVWEYFGNCGEISNVRLVRDANTNMGKGFGYVEFQDSSSVSLALQLNGLEFEGRKIRISKISKKEKDGGMNRKDDKRAGGKRNFSRDKKATTKSFKDKK